MGSCVRATRFRSSVHPAHPHSPRSSLTICGIHEQTIYVKIDLRLVFFGCDVRDNRHGSALAVHHPALAAHHRPALAKIHRSTLEKHICAGFARPALHPGLNI
jgi:hypothetical protein